MIVLGRCVPDHHLVPADHFLYVVKLNASMFDISQTLHVLCQLNSSEVVLIDQCRLLLRLTQVSSHGTHACSVPHVISEGVELRL